MRHTAVNWIVGRGTWPIAVIVAGTVLNISTFAAGVGSRRVNCGDLHALITSQGFIFIPQPFGDFVVAKRSFCAGGERPQTRSVAAIDTPQCLVDYSIRSAG